MRLKQFYKWRLYLNEDLLQDPSVQQATASSGQTAGLEDYDPFNKQKTTKAAEAGGVAGGGPAVMSPTQEAAPPPSYTQSAQNVVRADDFQVRQVTFISKSLSCTNVKYCFKFSSSAGVTGKQTNFALITLVHSGS